MKKIFVIGLLFTFLLTSCVSERKPSEEASVSSGDSEKSTIMAESDIEGDNESSSKEKYIDDYPDVTLNPDLIYLIYEYENPGKSDFNSGFYIDGKGDIYSYYFRKASLDAIGSNMHPDMLLYLNKKYADPVGKLDMGVLKHFYSLGQKIDYNAKCSSEIVSSNEGQYTLRYVNYDLDIYGGLPSVVCGSTGDRIDVSTDENAVILWDEFHKELDELNIAPADGAMLLAKGTIPFCSCHKEEYFDDEKLLEKMFNGDKDFRKFFLKSKDELDEFLKLTGYKPESAEWEKLETDNYVFFAGLIRTSQVTGTLNVDGLMKKSDSFDFVTSSEDGKFVYFDPEQDYDSAIGIECFIFAYPCDPETDFVTDPVDFNGEKWEKAV